MISWWERNYLTLYQPEAILLVLVLPDLSLIVSYRQFYQVGDEWLEARVNSSLNSELLIDL